MDPPPVQYATTSDGKRIAYGVSGKGPPLVFLPGVFYHVQLAWQFPGLHPWLEQLAQRFQLIQLDPRGTGMSSRDVGDDHVQEHYQRDMDAVVQKLGLGRFLILGYSRGVDIGVDYALRHPEQVIALLLGTSGTAKGLALFEIVAGQDWDLFLYSLVPRDRSSEEAHLRVELHKQATDQRNFVLRTRAFPFGGADPERLAALRTATLVMHARDYVITPVEEGMKVAQHSGGRLVLLDGSDPWGDATQGLKAIESFLAELATQDAAKTRNGDGLSSRELEVLALIAAGRSNQQIADELVLSVNTVQRHVSNIFGKTGLANRTEAAGYARDRGLV